ncbi:hypothetical protein HPP92_017057 [Vanilla planifolia]|uniref:Uncharacterized protein n=1 Tax=Vanilla planifolia TaxID=51239 RepID=A0A835QK30_VANPL|nr:hypothetical protein HPP92_017057 [Vanilla planifolia]
MTTASATAASIACSRSSLRFHRFQLPLPATGMAMSSPCFKSTCAVSSGRHFWIVEGKRLQNLARFASDSDRQPEDPGEAEPLDEDFLPSDDADYLWKLLASSVGGGFAIKYGSILFPDVTRPNLLQALVMVLLPVLVATLILIKESSFGSEAEDQF